MQRRRKQANNLLHRQFPSLFLTILKLPKANVLVLKFWNIHRFVLHFDQTHVQYKTGHGEVGTGDWCFHDGTISIQEMEDIVPTDCLFGLSPLIISDTCYSGNWANYCNRANVPGFDCLAAAPEFSVAMDTGKLWVEPWTKHNYLDFEPRWRGRAYVVAERGKGTEHWTALQCWKPRRWLFIQMFDQFLYIT